MARKMQKVRKVWGRGLVIMFLSAAAAAAQGLDSSGRLFVGIHNQLNIRSQLLPRFFFAHPSLDKAAEVDQKKLEIGDSVTGTVTEVYDGGAYVDIGREVTAHVDKASIRKEWTDKASDVLAVGDSVQGRVYGWRRNGQVNLVMKEIPQFSKRRLSEYSEGDEIEGEIMGLTQSRRGKMPLIYVDIGAIRHAVARGKAGEKIEAGIEKGMKVKVKVSRVGDRSIEVVPL
eukprot:TRINITY_DN12848_c0_g2_i5.p1 TRINITY_DN12848_c0_g2~~TRINITY_DN12848_c0_g2_i5.p1  ORF type:complete len:253 (-),score=43.21 TRINITY_DN12848_c0_g2_i5:68-754(-)